MGSIDYEGWEGPPKSRRFFLFTHPRSASNLLVRILALDRQQSVHTRSFHGGYFFMDTRFKALQLGLCGKPIDQWPADKRAGMGKCLQNCYDRLEDHLQEAESMHKNVFVKEHCSFFATPSALSESEYGTDISKEPSWKVNLPPNYNHLDEESPGLKDYALPEAFLQTVTPTFLIRHPALAFPSEYRTIVEEDSPFRAVRFRVGDHKKPMTLKWTRKLHDWYLDYYQKSGESPNDEVQWPIVLDADDVQTSPEVISRYAHLIGLNPRRLSYSWREKSPEELEQSTPAFNRMLSTLNSSTGIQPGKTSHNIDIDEEVKKWEVEFGVEGARDLEYWVRKAMPDYEALRARRLLPLR